MHMQIYLYIFWTNIFIYLFNDYVRGQKHLHFNYQFSIKKKKSNEKNENKTAGN